MEYIKVMIEIQNPTISQRKATYSKHLGYYCTRCQEERRLKLTRLCPCLDFEESPTRIKAHINAYWVPIYADVGFRA